MIDRVKNAYNIELTVNSSKEFSPQDKIRFCEDLEYFANVRKEEIAERLSKSGEKDPIHKAKLQVEDTVENISKILSGSDHRDIPLNTKHRAWIAQQVMHQAAHPEQIYQGYHNTCNTAVLEVQMYTKDPAQAARLVASIVCSGQYTTADCKNTIKLNKTSMTPHADWSEATKKQWTLENFLGDNIRSLASQIWQSTAINLFHKQPTSSFAGKLEYVQGEAVSENPTGDYFILNDLSILSGDALKEAEELKRNGQEIPVGQLQGSPQMNAQGIQDLHDLLMPNDKDENGKPLPALIEINNSEDPASAHKSIYIGKKDLLEGQREFKNQLQQLKDKGRLPIALAVNDNNLPFQGEAGIGWPDLTKLESAGHVINITDTKEDKVAYDNQNILACDHLDDTKMVSIETLYNSTLTPSTHTVYLNSKALFEKALHDSKLERLTKSNFETEMQTQEKTVQDEAQLTKWYQSKYEELHEHI